MPFSYAFGPFITNDHQFQPTSLHQSQPASFHRGEIFRLDVRYAGLVFFASVNGDPLFAFNSGSGQLNMPFAEAEVTGALEPSFFGFLPPGTYSKKSRQKDC